MSLDSQGYVLFLWIAPFCFVLLVVALGVVWKYRHKPSARSLVWYLGLIAWLLGINTLELVCGSEMLSALCAKLEYLAFLFFPIAWLSFSLRYSGLVRYLSSWWTMVAVGVSMVFLAIIVTNEFHGWFWREVTHPRIAGLVTFRAQYGPLFPVVRLYVVVLLGLGIAAILSTVFGSLQVYRSQSIWLVAGFLLPIIGNAIYVLKVFPSISKDYTPIAFAFSGLFFVFGILRRKVFSLMPIPRSSVVENLDCGVVVLSSDRLVVDINAQASRFLGTDRLVVGQPFGISPVLAAIFLPHDQGETGEEARWHHHQVNGRVLSSRLQVLLNHNASAGFLVILDDVTASVQAQHERDQIMKQLVEKQKLAGIGQLTASVAHEINNPLSYVASEVRNLGRLVDRGPTHGASLEAARDSLAAIQEGLGRIEAVVHGMLSYARFDRRNEGPEPYEFSTGIRTTLDIVKGELLDGVTVRLELEPVPPILAQRNEINQVILIIVTNALQALAQGGREPTESWIAVRTFTEGAFVVCEISNSGPAIPPDQVEQIFVPFYSAKTGGEGTGLGLGIAREIVEGHHQGRLYVKSPSPVVFRFELPVPLEPVARQG